MKRIEYEEKVSLLTTEDSGEGGLVSRKPVARFQRMARATGASATTSLCAMSVHQRCRVVA
jgi:hypothetical protein